MPSSEWVASVAAGILAAGMVAWAAILPIAPHLHEMGGTPAMLARLADATGAGVCHRQPERSFESAGVRWPVCARCTGIYFAAGTTVLVALGLRLKRATWTHASAAAWRAAFAMALFPIVLTWTIERTGAATVSNVARAISGVPLGAVVATVVLANLRRPS